MNKEIGNKYEKNYENKEIGNKYEKNYETLYVDNATYKSFNLSSQVRLILGLASLVGPQQTVQHGQ